MFKVENFFSTFANLSQSEPSILSVLYKHLDGLSDTARLDAQVLLAHISGKTRAWVLAHPEMRLSPERSTDLEAALTRLEAGEPLPHVLGHWEFYGLDILVTPDTLIPRPETEQLVEQALDWLHSHPERRWAADVGTGSGCIAIALAVYEPTLHLMATDVSWLALQVARQNALRHQVGQRIDFLQADLLPSAGRLFDLVCANLPYIPSQKLASLRVARHEPALALDGGPDGLGVIRRFLLGARDWLAPGGLLLVEIEAYKGEAVRRIARSVFPHGIVQVLPDLAGHDRVLKVEG